MPMARRRVAGLWSSPAASGAVDWARRSPWGAAVTRTAAWWAGGSLCSWPGPSRRMRPMAYSGDGGAAPTRC